MTEVNFGNVRGITASHFRVTAVADPIVTLDELKLHLGIYEDDFDAMLRNIIIPASTEIVSNIMGEYASATTVQAFYRDIADTIILPHNHVASITSVQYYDDVTHTLMPLTAGTDFIFDTTTQPAVLNVIAEELPSLSPRFENALVVTYSADIADQLFDISAIVQATMMIAADLWYNRSNQTTAYSRASMTADRILAPLKRVMI